jgi:RND family efflux transporter MFP subunit
MMTASIVDDQPPGRARRRWPVVVLLAAVLLLGGLVAVRLGRGPHTTYQTQTATVGTLRLTVTGTGTLQPASAARLAFQVAGQVTAVPVSVGQQVTAGQTLATLDSAPLAAQVAQTQATLSRDQATLSADRAAGAGTDQLAADQAAVDADEAALAEARAAQSAATLTSPIAGTVAQVGVTVGEQVGAAGTEPQVVVADTGLVASLAVDDTRIGLVKEGQPAAVTPAGASSPVTGTVTSVGLLATGGDGVATFPVEVTLSGAPQGWYAGATAVVAITYRTLDGVLRVPSAAVGYSGSQATVRQRQGGKVVTVPVTVGASADGYSQITSGLAAGQQVLTSTTVRPRRGLLGR